MSSGEQAARLRRVLFLVALLERPSRVGEAERRRETVLVALLLLQLVGTATVHFEPASDVRPQHSRLEISRKGKHWSPHLIRPVFRRQVVLVPGAARRARLPRRPQPER